MTLNVLLFDYSRWQSLTSRPNCWPMRTLGCAPCSLLWRTRCLCEDEDEDEDEDRQFRGTDLRSDVWSEGAEIFLYCTQCSTLSSVLRHHHHHHHSTAAASYFQSVSVSWDPTATSPGSSGSDPEHVRRNWCFSSINLWMRRDATGRQTGGWDRRLRRLFQVPTPERCK